MRRHVVCWLLLLAPAGGLAQQDLAPSTAPLIPAPAAGGGPLNPPPPAGRPPLDARPAPDDNRPVNVPFAFYNDLFGFAGGYSYARTGFLQPQTELVASAMAGTAGSGMVFLKTRDLIVPGFERLFADPMIILAYFNGNYVYRSGNPEYPGQQAGNNGSSYGNYVKGDGWEKYLRLQFRYLLPIGWGRDHVVDDYHLEHGLLVSGASGGESLNPFKSGKTFIGMRPFYLSQTLNTSGPTVSEKTNGLDFTFNWDNRDFYTNPSTGQSFKLRWSRDFGRFDSTTSWTAVTGEVDQYFSLGATDWFRQRVIALDVWTADSPTWSYRADGKIAHRPPTFAGATLGGWWQMRGYRIGRFSDKAAIAYAAEYRMIPRWNPFDRWAWVQDRLGVQWIQLVPFAEVGRVAERWDLKDLHSSMKWDLGFGFRFLARRTLVRVDLGVSPEGAAVQMLVEQPFQF